MIRSSHSLALGALILSAGLHVAGIAAQWQPDMAEMQGGAPASVARLGDSFRDVVTGNPNPVAPQDIPDLENVPRQQPLEPDTTLADLPAEHANAVFPKTSMLSDAPLVLQPQQAKRLAAQSPASGLPAPPEAMAKPVTVTEAIRLRQPAMTPKTTTTSRAAMAAPVAPDMMEPHQARPATLSALPETVTAPALSARPQRRPDGFKVPKRARKIAARPRRTARKEPQARQKPGNGQTNETTGSAQGQSTAKARSSATRTASKPAQAGNAAASNYPGLVLRKIQRRKPRTNIRGTAIVTFSVAANGALASLSLAQSSGSAQLDKLALSAVRRAAPFPKPPAGAKRRFRLPVKGR